MIITKNIINFQIKMQTWKRKNSLFGTFSFEVSGSFYFSAHLQLWFLTQYDFFFLLRLLNV